MLLSMADRASLQALAQEVQIEPISEDRASPLRLRGTTGSGEQEAVFDDTLSDVDPEELDQAQDSSRDTSDPVRQLQGRATPVQPEPAVADPLLVTDPGPRSNVRAAQSQPGTGALADDQPFEPTGLRLGTWRLFANLEQSLGYSTNTASAEMGEAGSYSQTNGSILLQSDWSRHSARIEASGSFRRFLDSETEDLHTASAEAGLTLDLVDGISVDGQLTYGYETESASSNNVTSSATSRPGVHSTGASIGLTRSDGKLLYAIRGSVGRTDYEAIELSDGGTQNQDDRNNTLYSLTGRVGYQTSPGLAPFMEGEIGQRQYDDETDRNGDNRNSTIAGARIGAEIDVSEKLTGEASIGYLVEQFDGSTLQDLAGLTLNGSIIWSPVRETAVTFNAETGFSGSTSAGQNGSVVSAFGVSAERQVNDRLSLTADAGLSIDRQDDGSQTDRTITVGAGFNYWINRFLAVTGRIDHTNQQSTAGGDNEYEETSVQTGLRWQR